MDLGYTYSVCRTAPATPGLVNNSNSEIKKFCFIQGNKENVKLSPNSKQN